MKFKDDEIEKLNLEQVEDFVRLIIEYLCGEKYYQSLSEDDKRLLGNLISNIKSRDLNYEQFNELLLLLNQDRVGKDFFKFFFEKDKISLKDLKQGIIKFRSFAMLCFGNFRFAYKQLIQKSESEIKEKLAPYWENSSELVDKFNNRPPKMLEIEKIEREKTWYLGEISGARITKEAEVLEKEINNRSPKINLTQQEMKEFREELLQMTKDIEEVQKTALKNTEIYLTWDYMDIYIATSMRNKWEFEETFDFIEKVFNNQRLKNLNLRYFDPTQCKCANPRDKGLIEGLMLKRAKCTIYLAQESDTMGKDSELAATLAQSKPVIAYVPKYEPEKYSQKIKEYPLEFFKKRLLILDAEEIFDDPKCQEKLNEHFPNFEEKIDHFLDALDEYRQTQPFTLYTEKDRKFKKEHKDFSDICQILSIAECYNFDRRAELLKGRHPLSMQVELQSGVANGVLLVRSYKECADLLYKILTNDMEFTIKYYKEKFTILKENISGSPFRVVTDHPRLTNSFWNLFT